MTPPKAETGSQAWALRWASATSAPTAMPQGLACLMIATAGSVEVVRRPARGVGVDVVVVGHLLAVQLLRAGQGPAGPRGAVERGGLVRVLAVAQARGLVPGRRRPSPGSRVAVAGVGRARCPSRRRPRRRRSAVCTNAAAASRCRWASVKPPSASAAAQLGVLVGRGEHGDVRVVLGRWPAPSPARRCRSARRTRPASRPRPRSG